MSSNWENGLFEMDRANCMAASCCPCFVFGRGAERMRIFPDTDETKLKMLNSLCLAHFLSSCAGICFVVVFLQRSHLRRQFDIEGNVFNDCLAAFCCPCCSISQLNLEMKKRAIKKRSAAIKAGYMAAPAMEHGLDDHALPSTNAQPPEKSDGPSA